MDWFSTGLIMGAVQGLTEFLPVSSSGHLVIAGDLLGFTGPKASTFEVAIQLGSIFAVLMVYWDRFMGLLLPGRVQTSAPKPFAGLRGIWLLFLTTLPPSVLGLLLHSYIKQLFTPFSVSLSLAVGGLLMLFVESYCAKRPPKYSSIDEVTPKLALGIGLCQCMALWPGFSRSGSTIMGGMLLGEKRALAAEYSLWRRCRSCLRPPATISSRRGPSSRWMIFRCSLPGCFSPSFSAGSPSRRLSPLWGASPCGLSPCIGCFLRR